MESFWFRVLFVIFCLSSWNNYLVGGWFMCHITFKDEEILVGKLKGCAEKHGYKLPEKETVESLTSEMKSLESKDFDDGCFTKCWYDSMDLVQPEGKINTESFTKFYKSSNITDDFLNEINNLFLDCVKVTELEFKDVKEIPCKFYPKIEVCVFKKVIENKKHLEEVCNKKP